MQRRRTIALLGLASSVIGVGLTLSKGWSSSRGFSIPCRYASRLANTQRIDLALLQSSQVWERLGRKKLWAIPETLEYQQQLEWAQHFMDPALVTVPSLEVLDQWIKSHAVLPNLDLVPPAYADDASLNVPDWRNPVLDPDKKYIYGADGKVIIDLMSKRPLEDNWFNQGCGIQAGAARMVDQFLRNLGVPQAFGWTIVLYTLFIKLLLFPLEQASIRSMLVNSMFAGKLNEVKEKYKGNDKLIQSRTLKINSVMSEGWGAGIAGSCLPTLLTLPIIWTLFFCWRRLAAENFEHFDESWLWVPSLSQPNPSFDFNLNWLLEFTGSQPAIGWDIYLRQLLLPAILVSWSIYQVFRGKKKDEDISWISFLSVALITWISLELPQAVSVYYLTTYVARAVEEELVKLQLRNEQPAFEVFEQTGEFPEGNFDEALFPTLHQAAKTGNISQIAERFQEGVDVNELDEKQMAPISYAAAFGNVPAVSTLCLAGADVLVKDVEENTLLHYAAASDHLDVLKYLIRFGENKQDLVENFSNKKWATWKNKYGYTIVDVARKNLTGRVYGFLASELDLEPQKVEVAKASISAEQPAGATTIRARALD